MTKRVYGPNMRFLMSQSAYYMPQSSQFVVPIEPAMDWLGRLFEMMPMRTGAQRCFYGAPSRINQGPKVR
jgi:hypothetical protein